MKKIFYATAIAVSLLGTVAATSCGSKSGSNTSVEATDGDWDKVIDAYEEAMDAYVDAVKSASSGDADAMKKMTEAEAKMAEYASKLDGANGVLTEAQAKRIAEIASKAAAAAGKISSSMGSSSSSEKLEEKEAEAQKEVVDESDYTSEASGENWDAVLDSYEKYVNNYLRLMKKAKAGDASALSEYASMLQEAQEFGEKLSNAQGELTPAQQARYLKITKKMGSL